jgi:hypothetical protein
MEEEGSHQLSFVPPNGVCAGAEDVQLLSRPGVEPVYITVSYSETGGFSVFALSITGKRCVIVHDVGLRAQLAVLRLTTPLCYLPLCPLCATVCYFQLHPCHLHHTSKHFELLCERHRLWSSGGYPGGWAVRHDGRACTGGPLGPVQPHRVCSGGLPRGRSVCHLPVGLHIFHHNFFLHQANLAQQPSDHGQSW